ncbi:MAG: DUF4166 domain-containing protein [Anaplasmataceae bacterium]|nr:DUF4166 domain-containing protein [Anaplasmataceae bacterium]
MTEPIFKSILGDDWYNLPIIFRKHYANKSFSNDITTTSGVMNIEFNWLINLLLPFLKFFGVLVPYKGNNIPVTVNFLSKLNSAAFYLERKFNLSNNKIYIFYSKIIQLKGDIVIEFIKFNIGWKYRFYYSDNKVILEHRGYVIKLFGKIIPLPIELLLGKTYAEENAIDDDNFNMKMSIIHPFFGKIYSYDGVFNISK